MTVSIDRAIKMKNLEKRSPNERYEYRTSRQFSMSMSTNNANQRRLSYEFKETSKTEELNLRLDTSKTSKRMENRVKFSNIRDSIQIEKLARSNIIENLNNSSQTGKKLQKCFTKLFKVDSVVAFICLLLFLFNVHYIIFLNVHVKKVKNFSLTNASLFDALLISNMAENEEVLNSLKKCTVETGTSYDVFLQFLWFWIDMSKIFIIIKKN